MLGGKGQHSIVCVSLQASRQDSKLGGRVQPHPPTQPADQSLLRVQRTRVRVVSGKKTGAASKAKVVGTTAATQDTSQDTTQGSVQDTTSDQQAEPVHQPKLGTMNRPTILSSDEQLALRVLAHRDVLAHQAPPTSSEEVRGERTPEDQHYSYRSSPKSAERPTAPLQVSGCVQ